MTEKFLRTRMLIGEEKFNNLKNKNIAVFGIGGVGSYVCEALVRCGIEKFSLFDSDTVSVSNINRQIIATEKTVGMPKVEVMAKRMREINSEVKIEENQVFFGKENANNYDFSKFDYIVDAIDTVTSKLLLIEKAKENDVKIISSMGTGNKLDPLKFEITDIYKTSVCPLAKVMRYELKKRGIKKLKVLYSKEIPQKPLFEDENDTSKRQTPASISFVPSVAGLAIAGEIVRELAEI